MRKALLALALFAARDAFADDPRDLFGLGNKKKAEKASCDDAKTLGCSTAQDDFDPVSPYAVRTWLPSSYLLKLPVADARGDAVAHYAVGVSRDEAGPAFGGASGLENRWTIEGAPADNLRNGNVETRVPLTFMQGMLVQAGGFAARDRTSTGGTIDVLLKRGGTKHEVEAHVWGSINGEQTRRPIPRSSYQLRRLFADAGPDTSASVVASGPLPGFLDGKAWYAGGVAPALAYVDFSWEASRLKDVDDNEVVDGFPGVVHLERISNTSERTLDYLVPVMARGGWERGKHAVDLTLIGQFDRSTRFLALATKQAAGIQTSGYVGDAIATYRGTWKNTRLRGQFAWHRSVREESAYDDKGARIPQLGTAYVPNELADDPGVAAGCYDRDPMNPIPGEPPDPYERVFNCPIPFGFFASGGAGLLTDTTGDRPSMTFDLAHRRGNHVLRFGATGEDSRVVLDSRFTGGEFVRSLFVGHTDRQRFYGSACTSHTLLEDETPCDYTSSQTLRYRTRYTAAYAEDTFEITPRIRVNGGVRWELMWVGPALHFSNQWAPRFGIAWDLLHDDPRCPDCTARAWTSAGRSFVMLPAGLGSTVIARNHTARDIEFGAGPSRFVNSGNVFTIAPGIQPAAQDEVTAGIEFGVPKLMRLVGWAQGRTLRRGYETVLYESGLAAFDNPGRQLEAPADRDTLTIAFEAMIAPTPRMTFRASYLYGRTVGTWSGPFNPREGATLYDGGDWDTVTGNMFGRLPSDAGHRMLFEIERRQRVGKKVELLAAARLTTSSGKPRSVLGDGDGGILYLLQRGTNGRNELVSQANVRLGARCECFGKQHTDITLDIFNLFDSRTPTNIDEVYAGGDLYPIRDGTQQDLLWLKTSDGSAARRRTAYQLPFAYQAPIAVTLGIHQTF